MYLERTITKEIDPKKDVKDIQEILKETITINRINCGNLIQGIKKYYIENKILYIELDDYNDDEYVRLSTFLEKNHETLTSQEKIKMCLDLIFATDYLHLHNQTHKKIYPENIFVTKEKRLILGEIGFRSEISKNCL